MELNHKQEVIATVGIPACGKSTWAERFMECWPDKYVRVERDIIRAEHHTKTGNLWDYRFTKGRENAVTDTQTDQIRTALYAGKSVIVSDTNLNARTRNLINSISKEYGIETEFHPVVEDLHVCMKRNSKRPNHVPESVMINMQKRMRQYMGQYVQTEASRAIDYGTKPSCVIMDIDGTMADMKGIRGPFEWDKVHLDRPIQFVVDYAHYICQHTDHDLIIFSGRDGSCRALTERWLREQGIYHNGLFMRTAGSTQNDSLVKEALFHKAIKDRYMVDHIVDDRAQVCQMWESMGFRVFNCGGFTADF